MQSNVKVQETSKVHLGGMSPSVKTAKPPKERPHLGGMSPSIKKAEPRNVRVVSR